MLKNLGILLLVVEINRLETFRASNRLIYEFVLTVAVRLTHRHLIHYATDLFLSVFDSMEPHVEYHPRLRKFVALLANLEQFVRVIQLLGGKERLQNYTAFGIAAKSRAEMGARNIIDLLDDDCAGAKGELQFKFNNFPLIAALLNFGKLL